MDFINCLLLIFIYFVAIEFSYAMDLVSWYKRGKHSVAFCILMVVGGILLVSVFFIWGTLLIREVSYIFKKQSHLK